MTAPSRTAAEAIAAGRAEIAHPTAPAPRLWYGYCLMFVRTALGIAKRYDSAIEAWQAAKTKHAGNGSPPAGVPVFWAGGRYGHIALSLGGGRILSTDIRRRGQVDEVSIGTIADRWGLTYLGWSEDLNGKPVDVAGRTAPPATPPKETDDMWNPDEADKIEKRYVLAHQRWLAETAAERSLSDALAAKMLADGKPNDQILAELERIWTPVVQVQAEALKKLG